MITKLFQKFEQEWILMKCRPVFSNALKFIFSYEKGLCYQALLKRCSSVWNWDHVTFKHSEIYLFKMCVASYADILFNYSLISIVCTALTHSHVGLSLQRGDYTCVKQEKDLKHCYSGLLAKHSSHLAAGERDLAPHSSPLAFWHLYGVPRDRQCLLVAPLVLQKRCGPPATSQACSL